MDVDKLVHGFRDVADAIVDVLGGHDDVGPSGRRVGQYSFDVATDDVAVPMLLDLGVGVLSEETGLHEPDRDVIVALDPVDGSTNYSRRIPWYATSMCAVDAHGPLAALVVNLATDTEYRATRGGGAFRDGHRLASSGVTDIADAVVALNGLPATHYGWSQFRSLGAMALDLCAVADGTVDGLVDATDGGVCPWDYLGGLLLCTEAGAVASDLNGRDLVVLDHDARRSLVAGATPALHDALCAVRNP